MFYSVTIQVVLTGGLTQPEWSPCRSYRSVTFAAPRKLSASYPEKNGRNEWGVAKQPIRHFLPFLVMIMRHLTSSQYWSFSHRVLHWLKLGKLATYII